ncbi:hypothetical protein [Halorhabdus rudnickae]|uniref:hypothetical protein n=1 Tax=Halorhabdus rudnickae TaxID=1775544 RepID=UPI001083B3CE|nr:hypothetical protein [Halorhabdus rudnickae]
MNGVTDPAKRIPKSLGTDTQFLGKYTLTDFAVAGLPGVFVVLLVQIVVPSSLTVWGIQITALTIPLAVLAIAVGGLFVYLTPEYTDSLDWLGLFANFQRSDTEVTHEEAKEYTHVERVHSRYDAIERTDGGVVGTIQVTPPTMALATDDEWEQKTNAFQDFVNTTVEFPIQIYSTTRGFPAAEYISRYEDRLSDPDVKSNEKLQALIQQYIDWYDRELAQRQMTIRDHYIIIPVQPREVRYERKSLIEKLAGIPVLGILVQIWTAPPKEEERAVMLEELDERRRRVERGLRGIEGCDTRVVDTTELTQLIAEYWSGTEIEYGNPEQVLRRAPLITKP